MTDQPRFLNQVLEVAWPGDARSLLAVTQRVEREAGRTPSSRWGPREIDVDILLLGDSVVDDDRLHVPHRGLAERRFVLEPLAELAPELVEPRSGRTVGELLAHILGT
jgi:2-amino-4-hydroxy-6-hydroxymethyldihydropteridine diphosphokinase